MISHEPDPGQGVHVPAGTVVPLGAKEWRDCQPPPDPGYLDIVVARVHWSQAADGWVPVSAHRHPWCGWELRGCSLALLPCLRLWVLADALWRSVR